MNKSYCPKCFRNCSKEGLVNNIGDDWFCSECEEDLVDADMIVHLFQADMVWKGRYVDAYQFETNGRTVGLWLVVGNRTQYIRVNFSTIQSILQNPTPEFTEVHVHTKFQFRNIVADQPFEIDFIKRDGSERRLVGELVAKPKRKYRNPNVVLVVDKMLDDYRMFDMTRLVNLRVNGSTFQGVYAQ